MKIEEIYETEVWKNLKKNALFSSKIEEIVKKSLHYTDKDHLYMTIKDNRLILSYHSKVINRDLNCQFVRDAKYELFIDNDNNLVINEMSGSLRSNYGYDFENTSGGVLDTCYSCEVYDIDGVELNYQLYSDSYDINEPQFKAYKNGFISAIESAYNPNLVSYANSIGPYLHANIPGDSARFVRQLRFKNELGIVINSSSEFEKDGSVYNPKEEYYFNTFLSNNFTFNPRRISITRNFPFATIDENHVMRFSDIYMNSGLTPKNYKDVANARFLRELIDSKEQNGKHTPKDVIDKYDLMIDKLKNGNVLNRTL